MATILEIHGKKQSTYKAIVRRQGKTLTKRFRRKMDAKDWARNTEVALLNGHQLPNRKRYTLGQAIEKYIAEVIPVKKPRSQTLHTAQLNWFKNRYANLKVVDISPALLAEIREVMRTEEIIQTRNSEKIVTYRQFGTINRYFQILKHVLTICERDWEWIDRAPKLKKLPEPKGRTRYLNNEEANKILLALKTQSEDLQIIVQIAIRCGSRLFETCALEWKDINFDNRTILFRETKTGHHKLLPMTESLSAILSKWKTLCTSATHLFPCSKKSKRPHVYDNIKHKFNELCNEIGLPDVTFHTLRHTVGSWSTQDGINRKIVGEVLGHRNLSTTDRYSHLDTQHLLPAIEKMEKRISLN